MWRSFQIGAFRRVVEGVVEGLMERRDAKAAASAALAEIGRVKSVVEMFLSSGSRFEGSKSSPSKSRASAWISNLLSSGQVWDRDSSTPGRRISERSRRIEVRWSRPGRGFLRVRVRFVVVVVLSGSMILKTLLLACELMKFSRRLRRVRSRSLLLKKAVRASVCQRLFTRKREV